MQILVIDKQEVRKQTIATELMHAGWLVDNSHWENEQQLMELVKQASIVVILDCQGIDWELSEWDEIFIDKIVVGRIPHQRLLTHVKDFADYSSYPASQLEAIINGLITKIIAIAYRNLFPVTNNLAMKRIYEIAKKASVSSAPIMITGETGVGKEVIAQYIHYHSRQSDGPFVAVNCAAIPETMIEAVLFGYEKGAFTNAVSSHTGKFEKADHGTLFLDEIGEMSLDVQSKLLRVLQTNEVEKIGSKDIVKVNVRIIAATNKNLMKQIQSGLFRDDLYYRINVINLKCIPLRDRREDISYLVKYFIKLYTQESGSCKDLTENALTKLISHDWPGNVRELQNVIHRSVVVCNGSIIDVNDIIFDNETNVARVNDLISTSLQDTEAEAIVKVLKETKGCRSDAAKLLKISPRTLRYKISKLKEVGVDVP